MWPYIAIGIIVIAAIAVIILAQKKKAKPDTASSKTSAMSVEDNTALQTPNASGLAIQFEDLQALSAEEEMQLVEIKDKKLLAKIDNAIPGTLQAIANSGAANSAQEMAKEVGKLYRVIIPDGAVLDKSRAMDGAFRASYREVANSIKGQANLVPVDASAAKGLAAVSAANAVMNVASMAVGQYYMAQINDQLESITEGIDKIASFQNKEFKGKMLALVAEVQKASTFQMEIMENDELRNRELSHLKTLEHECAELLGQANLSLEEFAGKTNIDYGHYETLVGEAQTWLQYQQILLQVMQQIAELTYALNLGRVSRENSFALLVPYAKQAASAHDKLISWHDTTCQKLKIDVDAAWRERQGLSKVLWAVPALFNDELHYKAIPKRTVRQIRTQTAETEGIPSQADDLFHDDVQFIAKDGTLYYLPGPSKK